MVEENQKGILKDSAGFTLIEFLVAIVVGSIVTYFFYNAYIFQDEGLDREARKVDAVQNARNAVDVLTRELRMLGAGVPDSASQKITAANYQSITYLANSWNVSTHLTGQGMSGDRSLMVEDSTGFISGQAIYICSDSSASGAITLGSAPPNSREIALPAALTNDYPTGCSVQAVDTVTYEFAGTPREIRRTLLPRTALNTGAAESLADNIDYFQLKFFNAGGREISAIGSNLTANQRNNVRKIELIAVAIPGEQENTTAATVRYEDGTSKTDGYYRVYIESDIKLRNMY